MSRSKWKGPFIIIKKSYSEKKNKKIICRNVKILPKFVGYFFSIYNGKHFTNLIIKKAMVNHKFGEFSITRFKK